MAQNFIAFIEGRADLAKAKREFADFKTQVEQPIKLTFDTNGLNAIFTGLGKQAQQAGVQIGQQLIKSVQNDVKNVKVNLPLERLFQPTGATSITSHLGIDVKTAQALKKELKDINIQGATLSKLTIGNNGNSFEAIVKSADTTITVLGKLEETEDQLGIKTSRWITTSQRYTTDFTNSLKQAQKESQLLSDKLKNIGDAFSTSGFDKNVAKIKSDLANIGTSVDPADTKRVSDAALEYLKIVHEIQDSLNGTAQNPLQGQDLANRYNDAEMALRSYNNAMEILKANAKSFGVETGNAVKQAQKESQALADKVKEIGDAFSTGAFDKEISKMESAFANIGKDVSSDDIKKMSDSASEYYRITQQIQDSLSGKSTNPLQGQDLADAYDKAQLALQSFNNAFAQMQANAKSLGIETGNAVKQAQNEAKRATQEAQAEADKLAQSITNIQKAFGTGEFDKNVSKMVSDLANVGKDVPQTDIDKMIKSADEYLRLMQQVDASLKGTATNPLQGQDLVNTYAQAQNALQSYNNAFAEMTANARTAGIETGNAMKQAQVEANKLATQLDKVSQSFITGTFDTNIAKMEQGLMNISDTVSSEIVKKMSDAAAEYYRITQQIAESINNPNQPGALQGQQLADAYEQASVALKTFSNAQAEARANTQKMIAEGSGMRNANQVETWAKNNSKALKKYGDQLDEIARKMRGARTQGELNGYINEFKNLKAEITAAGLSGQSFADQFKRAFVHIGEFTGIYAFTSQVRKLPREMVQEVIKIDTAMTELRKVSTASASEISNYFEQATESAYKYGQTINEVIDSTASWTRLGYDLEDASILTDVTAELAQVGSGLDTKSATEGLQATIRGFGLAADEAKRVGDMINYIADTEPIDAIGIINGLERSSAAMSEANNSLEETIGLITASTSVTQDATAAGTAWRTISMRIRGKVLCLRTGKVCMQCCA